MTDSEKIETIANHYGFDAQCRQLTEEMAELTIAINKWWRVMHGVINTDDEMKAVFASNVIEEIADVLIMIDQIKYLCEIPDEALSKIRDFKLDRQMKRIKKDNNVGGNNDAESR